MLKLQRSKPILRWAPDPARDSTSVDLLPRHIFTKLLCVERQRAERSGRRIVLMRLESASLLRHDEETGACEKIVRTLSQSIRDTDIKGWHSPGSVIGVIFTEISSADTSIVRVLSRKVNRALATALSAAQREEIRLSFYVFPDDCGSEESAGPAIDTFYPDIQLEIASRRISLAFKRAIDIVGSLSALLILAPLLILIAVAVKLTSPGPILFRQRRLGMNGRSFTFLKFRSMYADNDPSIHERYIRQLIADKSSQEDGAREQVYKLKGDPRITPVGRFLRKTSLDELPQFANVLTGCMSLVGPRPPVPYEFAAYQVWHRRRLLASKPGITGFWQVEGRSRVRFDEMVRMDLEYSRAWSLWLDFRILLKTPRAVLSGDGAY